MSASLQVARLCAVVALVAAAGALATPKGRVPLALRGLVRVLRRDCGRAALPANAAVPLRRKLLAFALVVLAAVLAAV